MPLFWYTLAHFTVDAVCAVTVLRNEPLFSPALLFAFIITYDLLAFATQPFVGLWLDKFTRKKEMVLLSLCMLAVGFTAPLSPGIQIVLVGLANSLFHVAAGAQVIEKSGHKMAPLGVFVSTGAVGLVLGQQYPNMPILQICFAALIAILFTGILFTSDNTPAPANKAPKPTPVSAWVPVALLFCISIRSFMGFAKTAPFGGMAFLPFFLVAFVFAGKFIGGFLCDKWGIRTIVWISVPLAALFYFVGPVHPVFWGLGQFFVNISMPITLYLLYRCMPNRPAFSFGLAASFLIPGFFVSLFKIPVSDFVFSLIFATNLVLLLWAHKKLYPNKTTPVPNDNRLAINVRKNNLPVQRLSHKPIKKNSDNRTIVSNKITTPQNDPINPNRGII